MFISLVFTKIGIGIHFMSEAAPQVCETKLEATIRREAVQRSPLAYRQTNRQQTDRPTDL